MFLMKLGWKIWGPVLSNGRPEGIYSSLPFTDTKLILPHRESPVNAFPYRLRFNCQSASGVRKHPGKSKERFAKLCMGYYRPMLTRPLELNYRWLIRMFCHPKSSTSCSAKIPTTSNIPSDKLWLLSPLQYRQEHTYHTHYHFNKRKTRANPYPHRHSRVKFTPPRTWRPHQSLLQ